MHDVGQLDLEQVDLLAQDQRQQQVERTREDVEVQLEPVRRRSRRPTRLAAAPTAPRAARGRRPSPRARRRASAAAIARAFSAPAASIASSARLVGAQLVVALAHRRQPLRRPPRRRPP